MTFSPVAIIGQACLLPGVRSPEELWQAVVESRDLITSVPRRYWGLSDQNHIAYPESLQRSMECVDTARGGIVSGFDEIFDPTGFLVPPSEVRGLDPMHHWILHVGLEALRSAGLDDKNYTNRGRGGLILGNLCYPTAGLAELAERHWLGLRESDPRNRFSSGHPIHFAARALGLHAGSYAIDAACASSLYAIKLACDRLRSGQVDFMLAGGVNRADNLFLHMGFHMLGASSKTGQSRPFHKEADGLVPAEGIAIIVLKRLEDAVREHNRIFGVIRGIGLSNDGRAQGLLVPSEDGQYRAMLEAYQASGIAPSEISLIECHATGTPTGDPVEIRSMRRIFQDAAVDRIPIGSLKSNTGHLITAAGAAALIKVLGAFEHRRLPPTRYADAPIDSLESSPFRLIDKAEDWDTGGRVRRAAVSAFGFGGNNAHLIVEEWRGELKITPVVSPEANQRIAIVAIGAAAGGARNKAEFMNALFGDSPDLPKKAEAVRIPVDALKFPPSDLKETLPQQTMALQVAIEAVSEAGKLPRERTSVFFGMHCDPEIGRSGARWRLPDLGKTTELTRDSFHSELTAAWVLGTMPNIVANRINSQFDFQGPSFSVASEELSGIQALEIASRALREREIDAAVVGAVDLSCEPVHAFAAKHVLEESRREPGDAAVVLVLKRLQDAEQDRDRIYAVLSDTDEGAKSRPMPDLAARFGHSHAASGLLHVAAAALSCFKCAIPADGVGSASPWLPSIGPRSVRVETRSFTGEALSLSIQEHRGLVVEERILPAGVSQRLRMFSGENRAAVLAAIREGKEGGDGPSRLAWIATDSTADERQRSIAIRTLERESDASHEIAAGIYFRDKPIGGELAFTYTFAAAAYPGMGSELFMALAELQNDFGKAFGALQNLGWVFGSDGAPPDDLSQLVSVSVLCRAHTHLSREILGLRPSAAIGISSGESNALFCLGAWDKPEELFRRIQASGLYTRELAGEFQAVRRYWKSAVPVQWACWRVFLPIEKVREAIAREQRAHILLIHAPDDCLIGGDFESCQRAIQALGSRHVLKVDGGMAAHCPEVEEFAGEWREIHRLPTRTVPGVRFYSNATNTYYELTSDRVADALLGQALGTVDYPKTILNAWHDGVRVFLEHGPWGLCSEWTSKILGEREHLALSLDRAGVPPLHQALSIAARLWCAGVPVRVQEFAARLQPGETETTAKAFLEFPAHLPKIVPAPEPIQTMAPAPWLPAVLSSPLGVCTSAMTEVKNPWVLVAQRHAAAHRQWLTEFHEAHQNFLAVRGRMVGSFSRFSQATISKPLLKQTWDDTSPVGPSFTREQLEYLSHGKISSVFGPGFEGQDQYLRQVRMPTPPLLLVDRVLAIQGEPRSMGLGTIWTQTDVRKDSWYLHQGRMPAGIMIESGQADLLLISWLGVDFLNQGQRVYRLLGCEVTYHGELPKPGETLMYDIHVDSHANQDGTRLFFFHYDCRVGNEVRLGVRQGQAGFFSDAELADSMGVLDDPGADDRMPVGPFDTAFADCTRNSFSRAQIEAFSRGDAFACFGPGFERTQTHIRTPCIQSGKMLLIDEVTHFNPTGGPQRRGYLRAVLHIQPEHWFFQGHFENDPCMPGTLMFEGCLQAMAIHLTGLGFTLERDGWRFEPVPEERVKLVCRGQVVPSSREVVCELFIHDVCGGPIPAIHADLLGTVDGLKAFYAENMGYRLVPDWPLSTRQELLENYREPKPVATTAGFEFGYASLLACAWGKPSDAFGEMYRMFDGHRRAARLPGPPYHFMSRVIRLEGEMGVTKPGGYAELEYDIPRDAWYFSENSSRTMPFCVLLEAALQPCGWLASYFGCALDADEDLAFRNLDGTGTLLGEIRPGARCLRSKIKVLQISKSGDMIIVGLDVECELDGMPIYRMNTIFGFFPHTAFQNQVGLPVTAEERTLHALPSEFFVDLSTRPSRYFEGTPHLPSGMLLMLDRVTGFWPDGGQARLGRVRAEKDVRSEEWFFKAHFYQDPVQPGSLGMEALLQLLQFYMIEKDLGNGIINLRFEPIALDRSVTWKYRGQVLPENRIVTTEVEIVEVGRDDRGVFVIGNGTAYVDEKRIYQIQHIGMRIVSDDDIRPFWRRYLGVLAPPLEGFYQALIRQFVLRVDVADALRTHAEGRSVLFLANHQCQIESMLFLIAISARMRMPVIALASAKLRDRWPGKIMARSFCYPGMRDPDLIRYFDQTRPESLPGLVDELRGKLAAGSHSVLVHVEGTRQTSCRQQVEKISSLWCDLALDANVPIVPVRFSGGLPVEVVQNGKLEFPSGYTGQTYYLGEPIFPVDLHALTLVERKRRVLDAIRALGPSPEDERPGPPDAVLAEQIEERRRNRKLSEVGAVLSFFAEQFSELDWEWE
jgi:acyl transferase domain-containing protein/3-hydroxymyristoyl/3-hydroxydecanoyl-(acyl carrier protein) dehydratase